MISLQRLQDLTGITAIAGGGTDNIDFLVGDGTAPNADAHRMSATFWVEIVQASIDVGPLNAGGSQTVSPVVPAGAPAPNWNFNFFIAQGPPNNLIPVDSLGYGGPNDTSYTSPTLNTGIQFDVPITVQQGNHPTDQGADNIQSGEMANNP